MAGGNLVGPEQFRGGGCCLCQALLWVKGRVSGSWVMGWWGLGGSRADGEMAEGWHEWGWG